MLRHHSLDRHLHRLALLDRRGRDTQRLDQQIALIELRQEHRAEGCERQCRHHKAGDTGSDRYRRALHRPPEARLITLLEPCDDAAILLLYLFGQPDCDHRRNECERENKREGEGDDDGQRHRHEGLALDACQGQQGDVNENNDGLPVDRWPDHLTGSRGDGRQSLFDAEETSLVVLLLGKPPQGILDDDNGAINDQAEIECAETHQVGGHADTQHPETSQHHRDRNHQGSDQRCPEIAEQNEEHDDDQQGALRQVLGNR